MNVRDQMFVMPQKHVKIPMDPTAVVLIITVNQDTKRILVLEPVLVSSK